MSDGLTRFYPLCQVRIGFAWLQQLWEKCTYELASFKGILTNLALNARPEKRGIHYASSLQAGFCLPLFFSGTVFMQWSGYVCIVRWNCYYQFPSWCYWDLASLCTWVKYPCQHFYDLHDNVWANFSFFHSRVWQLTTDEMIHGLRTPNEAFFHQNPKLLGLARQIWQMGYFQPIYQHPFEYCESLVHIFH